MEEFNISKYHEAPYLELDDYKAPKGIKSYFVNMDDGIKIRICHWLQQEKKSTGTIFLQQGHNEFIEKYFETIQEFIDRGYSVICFDWRGQGVSERMIDDIHKSFIPDIERHDKDLEKIIQEIKEPPKNKLRKVIFKMFSGLTKEQKLRIVGQLIGRSNKTHPDDIYQAMIDIHDLGQKITIKRISEALNVSSRTCLLYTSPSPRDKRQSRMPSSA